MARDPTAADRLAGAITERARSGFALVSIDGPGGSGKSTLTGAVAELTAGAGRVTIVPGDDFYRPMPAHDRLLLSPQDGYQRTSTGSGCAIRCLVR